MAEDAHSSSHLIHAEVAAGHADVAGGRAEVAAGHAEVVVGVGARPGTPADEVLAAVDAVLPPGMRVVVLATLDRRAAEPGVQQAAAARGWTLVGRAVAELARVPVPSPSARVAAALGVPSVAEAAALAEGGELLVPKTVRGRVTVAVAAR